MSADIVGSRELPERVAPGGELADEVLQAFVTFGGAAAQLQAALTTTGGEDSDVANAFLPVAFNLAIFAAGILGAALLTRFDGLVLPIVMIVFALIALQLTIYGRRSAFSTRL